MQDPEDLARWFSAPRISSYRHHPDPAALYGWNAQLAAAYFEVIGHVEVLLRNFISDRLAAESPLPHWYDDQQRYQFTSTAQKSIRKARSRLRDPETTGRVVAELSFDFWRFLLVRNHEVTIWRVLRRHGMAHYPQPQPRQPFEDCVQRIYKLRNRIAHHEPLIHPNPAMETRRLDQLSADLDTLARWIDPDAADWIASVSRVSQVRSLRP
ncbi:MULTISPECIES: Abi family protein [Mycobacteriales]|uniref:Abi family protein n=1 Tax=Tsukamurella spumae TaxID=44753 RepID=A0A846X605_9ACTN|nr:MULTISPECIES: Abi family protein [Mycobacteriales]NKY20884.1 hypothetical protein [Tsukamurella spumae]OAV76931.1 hypothetical protein AYO52_16990 [Dietzia sp. 111N12-1]